MGSNRIFGSKMRRGWRGNGQKKKSGTCMGKRRYRVTGEGEGKGKEKLYLDGGGQEDDAVAQKCEVFLKTLLINYLVNIFFFFFFLVSCFQFR